MIKKKLNCHGIQAGLQIHIWARPAVPKVWVRIVSSPTARNGIFVLLNSSHHYTLVEESTVPHDY
jgi:hypothetical protein